MAMAYSLLITSVLNQIINSWPNKKLMNYSYLEQLRDMLPQIGLSLGMGVVVYFVQYLGLSSVLTLVIQGILGVMLYVAGSKLFHVESFEYLINVVNGMLHKKKNEV
jgi:hypothetical protein